MYRVLLIAIVLILYGSLWPWQYNAAHVPGNPLLILLHSWPSPGTPFKVKDIVINLLLYIPVGMFGYMALDSGPYRRWRVMAPIVLGLLLSAAVEIAQVYDLTRHCSAVDLLCNTVSAALGVVVGFCFRESLRASRRRSPLIQRLHASGPLALVYMWIAYEIIPLFPLTFNVLPKLHALLAARLSWVELLASMTAWLVIARLLEAIYDSKWAWRGILLLSLLVPVRIFIEQRSPSLSELAGLLAALVIWRAGLSRVRLRTVLLSGLMMVMLIYQGLQPFHFAAAGHFSWVPFLALLQSPWEAGLIVLCQKSFWYGSAVWLLWAIGRSLTFSSALIASLLAAIEVAQVYLPGRTAEITDPLLALILGSILWFLKSHSPRTASA